MKLTTFLNLSGGVDSTYYLWKWLTDNPDEKILVHHCLYFERRVRHEKDACERILEYLTDHGLTNFKYVETAMQKGTLKGKVLDIEAMCGISSIVVKNHPSVHNVLLSYCAEESPPLNMHIKGGGTMDNFNTTHRYFRINKVMELITERNFNYICYRGSDGGLLSKKEMIHTMPRKLFDLTWYCRRPNGDKPCGSCHTCKKVRKAFR